MQSLSMTIFADLYTPEERTRLWSVLAGVWALSALLGPLAGAFIVEQLSWPWVFWINVPIGIAAIAGLQHFLHENVEKRTSPIDYAGAVLVCAAASCLMLTLTIVSQPAPDAALLLALAAGFVVSLALLLRQERRAPDPIVPIDLWIHKVIAPANATTLAAGLTFIGITSFLPVYVQVVMSRSALTAGLTLTAMAVGWPLAVTLTSRLYRIIGMQATARLGGGLIVAGTSVFLTMAPASGPVLAGFGSMLCGFGLGFLNVTSVLLVQGSVDWSKRGTATASNVFARTLGNTMGAAILGTVLNLVLTRSANITAEEVRHALDQDLPSRSAVLLAALDHGLHITFWGIFAFAVVTALLSFTLPSRRLDQLSGGMAARSDAALAPE
jgi:MFS family permease